MNMENIMNNLVIGYWLLGDWLIGDWLLIIG
jgi:hypothetical protein